MHIYTYSFIVIYKWAELWLPYRAPICGFLHIPPHASYHSRRPVYRVISRTNMPQGIVIVVAALLFPYLLLYQRGPESNFPACRIEHALTSAATTVRGLSNFLQETFSKTCHSNYAHLLELVELFRSLRFFFGGLGWNRTTYARIFNPPLYLLSYQAMVVERPRFELGSTPYQSARLTIVLSLIMVPVRGLEPPNFCS